MMGKANLKIKRSLKFNGDILLLIHFSIRFAGMKNFLLQNRYFRSVIYFFFSLIKIFSAFNIVELQL